VPYIFNLAVHYPSYPLLNFIILMQLRKRQPHCLISLYFVMSPLGNFLVSTNSDFVVSLFSSIYSYIRSFIHLKFAIASSVYSRDFITPLPLSDSVIPMP